MIVKRSDLVIVKKGHDFEDRSGIVIYVMEDLGIVKVSLDDVPERLVAIHVDYLAKIGKSEGRVTGTIMGLPVIESEDLPLGDSYMVQCREETRKEHFIDMFCALRFEHSQGLCNPMNARRDAEKAWEAHYEADHDYTHVDDNE